MIRGWFAALGAGAALLTGCSGGGKGLEGTECVGFCQTATTRLEIADVERVLARGIAEARARDALATFAIVDRVGNVLAVYRMGDGAPPRSAVVDSGRGVVGGLEGAALPDDLVAIAKALTAAYLSSEGNAFTPRTASQIVQEHFNPGERGQPAGPLFGVQFSSLPCSDLSTRFVPGSTSVGPHRSPLGLSADAGALPLYKDGALVGGVGVIADGVYSLDRNLRDEDRDLDELVAVGAQSGYEPPDDRRADRITVDGKTLRYSDVGRADLAADPDDAAPFDTLPPATGALVAVSGYADATIRAGTAFGTPASGIRAAAAPLADLDAFVLVDAMGVERYPPRDGSDATVLGADILTEAEVTAVLRNALTIANRTRAQIRRPLGSQARVSVSVVDSYGTVLGFARTRDAPVFGADVSLQKARTAAFFSNAAAAGDFEGDASLEAYLTRSRVALDRPTLFGDGAVAFTPRTIGNLARPFFPDGLDDEGPGPFSLAYDDWSPFSTGLQLDLVAVATLGGGGDPGSCSPLPATDVGSTRLGNGIQIFAGGVPIYRDDRLVGAVGISGDGIDQDDMIAFLGLHEAGRALGGSIGNAAPAMRADRLDAPGGRLRYVQCPQAPFLDSDEQNVCGGK